jgi:hypothetical protein
MSVTVTAILVIAGLLGGILLFLEAGIRLGASQLARCPDGARAGVVAVEGAIFGLMGLVLAFTFSGAASRFDGRRQLILEEANAIGTAWLRLDILPAGVQPELRAKFRDYLDTRVARFRSMSDPKAVAGHDARAAVLQGEIWSMALAGCRVESGQPSTMLVLPALNAMFDIATARNVAAQIHPPPVIYGMLTVLAFVCSLLAGVGMSAGKTRSWLHIAGFALIMAITVYVIVDLEHPRLGLIRIDNADQVLLDLRQSMK